MAEQPEDSLTQNIRDSFLQCKICLDGLKEPKTLPCLHTFCAECLFLYIERNHIESRKFCCPICRRQIYIPKNGVDGFPDSFFVASLADIVDQRGSEKNCGICKFRNERVEAKSLCIECKVELCDECGNAHSLAKVTEGHTLLPLSETPIDNRDNYCRVHRGETIKYYCETCNAPICLPCTFIEHRGHSIEEIKDVRHIFSQDMAGLVSQSREVITQLTQSKAELSELENELFIRKEAVKTDIRRSVQQLLRTMNEQEAKLMNELDTFYDVVSISRDRQRLERGIYRLERAHDFAEQLLSEDTSPITQLVNKAEARDNLQQALSYEAPDLSQHAKKLDGFVHFLPGPGQLHVGSLLQCASSNSNSISQLRHILPSTRAVYMHSLRSPEDGTHIGHVISVNVMSSGDIVVLLQEAKKVRIFGRRGKMKFEFGSDTEIQNPTDMTITRDGNIAITDYADLLVKIFDPFGIPKGSFGGSDMFQLPIALTVDDRNKFLICDQVRQRVTIHRESGEILHEVEISEIRLPQYICCRGNKVFIADCENNIISIYNYNKTLDYIAKLTTPENNSGEFLDVSGICMDKHGNLLVADTVMDRVHVFNTHGEISCLQASGKSFIRPGCMAAGPGGTLVVTQAGVDLIEPGLSPDNSVSVYKVMKADV